MGFPIVPLKDVIEMVTLIARNGGVRGFDDIADDLGQVRSSGAFRGRTAAGRMYGAVETVGGELVLTELGRRMASPPTQAEALAEAFLNVELYEKLFHRYEPDGGRLPAIKLLDNDVALLGVLPQRAEKARQVFMRSAETAGYFRSGRDRLIRPTTGNGTSSFVAAPGSIASMPAQPPEPAEAPHVSSAEAVSVGEHWLVKALVAELPPRDEPPTPAQLRRFMDAMRINLEIIYGIQVEQNGTPATQYGSNGTIPQRQTAT